MPLITTDLTLVLQALRRGEAVAIPTETVYGLAAMIDKEQAIRTVFTLKQRPLSHPLIVHIAHGWDLSALVTDIPNYLHELMANFWPGPLTLVFRSKPNTINPLITGGQPTIAIRCPAHPLTQSLLEQLQTPLVAPSANPFGKISPTTAMHVKHSFCDSDLLILDGGRCSVGIESTIIDATNLQSYQILRHGMIDETTINNICSTKVLHKDNSIRVPGKLDHHYQPKKKLYYFEDYDGLAHFCQKKQHEVYVLARKQPETIKDAHFYLLAHTPQEAAYELFYQLRKADESNAACIAIELPPKNSAWEGIRERILKAGSPDTE
ncbi:MAG: threonylcarbamoyl-AMP synthase [Legionella sp.]|nr:threonylcarbamoyl-AMP synthase [Legionella sp.]